MIDSSKALFREFYQKKASLYWLSALMPMALMLIVWTFMGVFPFGNNTLMSIDFGQQYISLYQFFKETILSNDWSGLFYSFSKSIGGAMIGIWGFNLLSPFNLIYVLLPTSEFRWAITLTIWLRYGATALAFAHLLITRYQGHTSNRRFLVPLLATAYAMSGLIVAYQMNPIFYDAMIMLPLVIVYLEKLLDGEAGWKFSFILALTLFLHFYMGYMICLFVALYTFYYLVSHSQSRAFFFKQLGRTILYSVLGVGMAFWILYPIFLNLLMTKGAYQSSLTFEWKLQINPLDMLAKLMIGAFDSKSWPAGPNLPNLFVGSLALFGTGLFFVSNEYKRREKVGALVILLVFFIAIVNTFFNKIWHMGQTPAGFFYRFSWILSFFMVLLSYRALRSLKKMHWSASVFGISFIYLAIEWVYKNDFSFFAVDDMETTYQALNQYVPTTFRILCVILLLIVLFLKNKSRQTKLILSASLIISFIAISVLEYFKLLILLPTLSIALWVITLLILSLGFKRSTYLFVTLMTMFELGLNALVAQSRMNYDDAAKFKDAQVSVLEVIDKIRPSQTGPFYRINKTFERSKNDPFMYDYPGLTHFSSNMERSTLQFMTKVGDSGSNASSYYGNGTALMDAFYGVKYVVDYQDYTSEDQTQYPERRYFYRNTNRTDLLDTYHQIWEDDRYRIYENENVLPIAFGVNQATVSLNLNANQVVKTHNALLSALSGKEMEVYKAYLFEETKLTNVSEEKHADGKKIYKKIDTSQDGIIEFSFTPQTDATYYVNAPIALKRQKGGATGIHLNGQWYNHQHSFDGQQLWNVANKAKGQKVTFKLVMGTTHELDLTDLYMITADQSAILPIIQERMAQGMSVTEWGNNFMNGTVNITDDSTYLMTSIPYNEGWQVKIDGQDVEPIEVWDAFMALPITKGEHKVAMTFIPPGWTVGLIISGISLIFILCVIGFEIKNRKFGSYETISESTY